MAVLLGLSLIGAAPPGAQHLRTEPLVIVTHHGRVHFVVEVADNDDTRERGLMFRRHLAGDHGMLFDFKTPQEVAFWMKNTLIPLDMLFVDADGRVVRIARNAVPHDETPIPSGAPVLGVIEIAGSRAAQADIEPGDRVIERIFRGR
jgi:hypothetical protein